MSTGWQVVVVGLAVLVGLEGILIVAMMRQIGRVVLSTNRRLSQPGDGGPAFETEVRIHGVDFTRGVLALFISPGCAACEQIEPSLPGLAERFPDVVILPIVTGAPARARETHAAGLGIPARADLEFLVEEWDIPGTPFGVAIGPDARVRAKGVLTNEDQIADVIQGLLQSWAPNEANGAPGPDGPGVMFPPMPSTQSPDVMEVSQ